VGREKKETYGRVYDEAGAGTCNTRYDRRSQGLKSAVKE